MEAALRGALAEEGGGGNLGMVTRRVRPGGEGTPFPGRRQVTPPPAPPSAGRDPTPTAPSPGPAEDAGGGAAGPRPVPGGERGAARTAPPPRRNKAPRGRASGRAALTADRRAWMRGPGTLPGRAGAERPLQSASCGAGAARRQPR